MATQDPTVNYSWNLPNPGGDVGTWGDILNAVLGDDVTGVDSVVKAVSDVANAALPRAGGTVTGNIVTDDAILIGERTSGSNSGVGARQPGDTSIRVRLNADGSIGAGGNGTDPPPTIITPGLVLQNVTMSAGLITSGTLSDARLSSNVALLNQFITTVDAAVVGVRNTGTNVGLGVRITGDTSIRAGFNANGAVRAGGDGAGASPIVITDELVLQNVTANASIINAGTFASARIPNLNADKITAGTFAAARIPNLPASQITSGTFPVSRGGTGRSSLNAGHLLRGDGTSDVVSLAPGVAGAYTYSTGAAWVRRNITVSTDAPSGGGNDGDIWYQYA